MAGTVCQRMDSGHLIVTVYFCVSSESILVHNNYFQMYMMTKFCNFSMTNGNKTG